MKTLIILKGLAKSEKLEWVKSQGLENFFLDYSIFKRLYSMPELDRDKTTDILLISSLSHGLKQLIISSNLDV